MYMPKSFGRAVLKEANKAAAQPYRRVKDYDVITNPDGQSSTANLMKLAYRGLNNVPLSRKGS